MKKGMLIIISECNRLIYQDKLISLFNQCDKDKILIEVAIKNVDNSNEFEIMEIIKNNNFSVVFLIDGNYSKNFIKKANKINVTFACFDSTIITFEDDKKPNNFIEIDDLFNYSIENLIEKHKFIATKKTELQNNSGFTNVVFIIENNMSISEVKDNTKKIMDEINILNIENPKYFYINEGNDKLFLNLYAKQVMYRPFLNVHNDYYDKLKHILSSSSAIDLFGNNSIYIYMTSKFDDQSTFYHLYLYLEQKKAKIITYDLTNDKVWMPMLANYSNEILFQSKVLEFYYLPVDSRKIIFSSYENSQFSCNPKAITEYIIENNLPYDLVWIFNDLNRPEIEYLERLNVKCVKFKSLDYYREIITSKIIVSNQRMDFDFIKRKNQIYFQTWHGNVALKFIEKSCKNDLTPEWIKIAKNDCYITDFLATGSKYDTKTKVKSFWYKHPIIEVGSPRNDNLINFGEEKKMYLKEKMNIDPTKKVVLYAPTFRNNPNYDYVIDFKKIINIIKMKFGGEWIFALKLHPNLLKNQKLIESFEKAIDVINLSNFDIQEALIISDIVISDYSSLMFDYAILKRPIFIYAPDYEEYILKERKLTQNIKKLPFKFSMTTSDLYLSIERFNIKRYRNELSKYMIKMGYNEKGIASKKIIEYIEKELLHKEV